MKEVTEYHIHVGELLKTGACKVNSLDVTQYLVNIIIITELSKDEFRNALIRCRPLFSSLEAHNLPAAVHEQSEPFSQTLTLPPLIFEGLAALRYTNIRRECIR